MAKKLKITGNKLISEEELAPNVAAAEVYLNKKKDELVSRIAELNKQILLLQIEKDETQLLLDNL